ncbi:hypothetical protein K402DRAFT_393290 [Aulographum hederae CBS 113979]|uniref:Uncharacterized protein n=1 Tax=Aulographum hederae CBS 113979 TaxID=1176131 RepID=A0A6G1H2D4_9PEZI|nr:hypothetical protein K402DRAFT_393290 [Aulographum hederae CBS 113979]
MIQHLLGEKHKVLILTKQSASRRSAVSPCASMYIIEVRAASYVHKEYIVNKGG